MKPHGSIFHLLRTVRAFRRQHLGFLETVTDYELVTEIGLHQVEGRPLSINDLHLLGLASVPTLQRRLRRLRQLGVVQRTKAEHDARAVKLTLPPHVMKVYQRYGRVIRAKAVGKPASSE